MVRLKMKKIMSLLTGIAIVFVWIQAGCGGREIERGGLGEPCYPNGWCDPSLICEEDICVPREEEQGGLGEHCYLDYSCDEPYICSHGRCVEDSCISRCEGRECGPDGCGGLCPPGCSTGQSCSASGQCVDDGCTPSCQDRECGPDGCGGLCPPGCSTGQACSASGQCVDDGCTPSCQDRECGPNGCGGLCPPGCSTGQSCDASGQCVDDGCTPNCQDRECGPDGCGGDCPPGCPQGSTCDSDTGLCIANFTRFETHFNEPSGGANDDHLEHVIKELLDMAVPGSTVRAAFYTWSRTGVAQAFVDALNAGVDVRVIVGNTNRHADGTDWQAIQILRNGLGSRLTICREGESSGGCIGDGIQHNKFTLFSELNDGSTDVVFQSSANHTNPQRTQFNNAIIIRGDHPLYDAYFDYWLDLGSQQQDLNYYRSFLGDREYPTKVYFFPRASGDTIVNILNNITCDGDSHIHVAMAYFTNPRLAIANTLVERFQEGCNVSVLVRASSVSTSIVDALSVNGIDLGIFPEDSVHNVHSKYLLVNAPYGSTLRRQKLVWTGSHNYTGPALRNHDETLLKIEDDEVYASYLDNWAMMQSRL